MNSALRGFPSEVRSLSETAFIHFPLLAFRARDGRITEIEGTRPSALDGYVPREGDECWTDRTGCQWLIRVRSVGASLVGVAWPLS